MFNKRINISLNCSEEIFHSNFALYIKKRDDVKCTDHAKRKLSGKIKDSEISLYYKPRCFKHPYSLPIATGTCTRIDNVKTKVELDVRIENHYPTIYLIIGLITYAFIIAMFSFIEVNDETNPIIEKALLVIVPILSLIISRVSFKKSVSDMEKEVRRYLLIVSKNKKRYTTLNKTNA